MYGNHPYGTKSKRDLHHGTSMARGWRTTDGKTHPVTILTRRGRRK